MNTSLRILWLKSGPLHPLDTGGKIRTYNMLKELKKKHDITFLSLCQPDTNEVILNSAGEYSQRQIWVPWSEARKGSAGFFLQLMRNKLFSSQPFVIQKYYSSAMSEKIRSLDSHKEFDLIICDFLTPAANLFAQDALPTTPTLLFQHNVESLIWKRLFANSAGKLKRAYFKSQWERMENFERTICEKCDAVAGVSEDDCRIFKEHFGLPNVIGSVPTGVDLEFFNISKEPRKPHSLVFLGSMDWMPNIDAVLHFAENIFPAIRRKFADATLTVVGRNPPPSIKALETLHPGLSVTGSVEDVRPFLAAAEVMIVPLRIGGGTRIKIYEGMATGIPIVSSRIGAEGLPVLDRQNILLADSTNDYVRAISELFEKSDLRKKVGNGGRELVERNFSWENVIKVFEKYCLSACESVRKT